ncbi:hypothetical protein QLQ12_36915 [Actinoplanes sp. NEAU-A12]|uniref:Uncharacterized protein n=1 Tax=Actinoplanes sandaracinus TaxID=3045177 RepID=A0ABT6WWQ7_9ACTN|nr:hypothetical protein [Actinoplanes sandaracinus]MDI6104187.1 hypothetical protein [Actinoplanes sandaracinus]
MDRSVNTTVHAYLRNLKSIAGRRSHVSRIVTQPHIAYGDTSAVSNAPRLQKKDHQLMPITEIFHGDDNFDGFSARIPVNTPNRSKCRRYDR